MAFLAAIPAAIGAMGAGTAAAGTAAAGTAAAMAPAAAGALGAGLGGATAATGATLGGTAAGLGGLGSGILGGTAATSIPALTTVPAAIPAFSYLPAATGITGAAAPAAGGGFMGAMNKLMDPQNITKQTMQMLPSLMGKSPPVPITPAQLPGPMGAGFGGGGQVGGQVVSTKRSGAGHMDLEQMMLMKRLGLM
jgi:hypothetical protein